MKRQCSNKCFYWTERDCSKNRFEFETPYSRVNYRGFCDHFQAYVGRDGISYPIIDEWGKGAKYWDHAWNPVVGCRKVSEGCSNCYAAQMAERFPELRDENGGFEPHEPKNEKYPPRKGVLFVGNMTDLFGEWNDNPFLITRTAMISLFPNPVKLILTKRPEHIWDKNYLVFDERTWIGVTGENQDRLNARLDDLCLVEHQHKWLSLEPLLGEIDLSSAFEFARLETHKKMSDCFQWVVVGAESGPNRRPCKLEWVRLIVEQCRENHIPVFVKQLDIGGKLEKNITRFPTDLMIRQVPWGK